MTIVGDHPGAGSEVAGAGDVNGDGIPDVIVADNETDGTTPNAAYVVFGRRTPSTVQLGSLGSSGFKITGTTLAGALGVGGAGDVNGDGLADVLIGDPRASFNDRDRSGSAYVVFGKTTTTPVDVTGLGNGGFRIDGPVAVEFSALDTLVPVDGAKDVNGDGLDDVVVGFEQAYCMSFGMLCRDFAGTAFVIFGRTAGGAIDTAALGSAGYSIGGTTVGAHVAGLGDFNGDAIPDVAVSRQWEDSGWVVLGRRPAANVDLTALGTGGFKITDSSNNAGGSSVAWSLAGLGDANGDQRPDLLVGSGWTAALTPGPQRAAAIFGGASTADVDVASLGSRGFLVTGSNALGYSNAAGDVNGDGLGDLLGQVGGAASLAAVFGKVSTTTVDVTSLGSQGVYLTSPRSNGSFAGVGDMTGDHAADIVVGAEGSNTSGVGHAWVASLRPTALRRLNELRYHIASFGLPVRLRDNFFRRLDRVQAAYVGGNQPAACRRLDRVIDLALRRLEAGRLTQAQGFTIVAGAGRVKDAAGC